MKFGTVNNKAVSKVSMPYLWQFVLYTFSNSLVCKSITNLKIPPCFPQSILKQAQICRRVISNSFRGGTSHLNLFAQSYLLLCQNIYDRSELSSIPFSPHQLQHTAWLTRHYFSLQHTDFYFLFFYHMMLFTV